MRLRRRRPAKCARTTRLCSSCTLNSPLGNFSSTVPVTSILSSLLIQSFSTAWNRRRRPPAGSHSFCSRARSAHHRYVRRLQPLRSFRHLEFHFGAFFEATVAVRLNGREVHEYILAVLPLNKPVALGCVKPFHCAFFFHVLPFQLYCSWNSFPTPKNAGERGFDARTPPTLWLAEKR